MNLIIETDIGHDPDDLFAITYLAAAGVNIRAILISPGDPDQIAIAKLLCDQIGLNVPIGTSKENRTKLSSGSIHYDLLDHYKYPREAKADGLGSDILEDVVKKYPDSELFVIGPVSSIGKYLKKHPEAQFSRATMQGGFLPYSQYSPSVIDIKFTSQEWMPTFNLNGDRPAGVEFLNANIKERRMVGKNICHTVMFDKEKYLKFKDSFNSASNLFKQAAEYYLNRHPEKKFHDPTAAVCHLHPEIGTWFNGKTTKMESGWTTVLGDDLVLADIDYNKLWKYLSEWK